MSKPFRIAKLISEKLSQIHSLLRKTLVCLMFNVKINYLKHNKNTTVEYPILEGVYNRVHRSKNRKKDNVNSAPKLHKIKRNTNLKIDTLLEDTYVC